MTMRSVSVDSCRAPFGCGDNHREWLSFFVCIRKSKGENDYESKRSHL